MPLKISLERDVEAEVLFPEAPAMTDENWLRHPTEGELAVDVLESPSAIIFRSAIAGVKPADIEVMLHNDMLTIRGKRQAPNLPEGCRLLVGECHWGGFSRSVILPAEVDADRITAEMHDGVLIVTLPKITRSKRISVKNR